jgi:spore coat protein CotH
MLIVCIVFSLVACNNNSENKSSSNSEDSNSDAGSILSNMADPNQVYGTTFGQGDTIDINIQMSDDEWNNLLENATAEEYHSADVTVNGTTVQNIGVRTKGFSSLTSVANSDSKRFGFKVKFDQYVDNQTLNGLDMMVLNSSFSDPSYMRELLTYSATAYLKGLTPYLSYCRLSVNGELYGLYLCIESYDDSFVERNTSSTDTVLYKAVSESCTLLTSDDGSGFDVNYGKDEDFSNIKKLIQILNNTTEDNKEELEAILDVDSVLKAIAVNTVMGNYDSYNGSKAHNYYLLYSKGKFSYIGWDYNMSFGGFSEDGGASVTVDVASPVYNVDISQRPLIQKLLNIDEFYDRYLGYIDSLSNYFADFESIVNGIADQIHTDVENDPTAFYTIDQFEENITVSDTDLTKVQNNLGNMGGQHSNFKGGIPYGTDTKDMPQMKPQAPDNSDNANTDRTPPQMPSSNSKDKQMSPSNGKDMNGNQPNMPYGNMKMYGGMGNMINQDTVSIVDYFTQRLEQINSQK